MTEILKRNKALSVNPLKTSQLASLIKLGFKSAMPLLQDSQELVALGALPGLLRLSLSLLITTHYILLNF